MYVQRIAYILRIGFVGMSHVMCGHWISRNFDSIRSNGEKMNGITIGNMQFHFHIHDIWFHRIDIDLRTQHKSKWPRREMTIHDTTFSVLILAFANVIIKFRRRQTTGTTDNGRRNKSKHRFSHTGKNGTEFHFVLSTASRYVRLRCSSVSVRRKRDRTENSIFILQTNADIMPQSKRIRTLFLAFAIHNSLFFSIRRESQTHTHKHHILTPDRLAAQNILHSFFFSFVERDDSSERDGGERERESTRRYFCA